MASDTKQRAGFLQKARAQVTEWIKPVSLEEAIASGNVDMVKRRLNEGVTVGSLHEVAKYGHVEIIELLLRGEKDSSLLERQDDSGQTALHIAVKHGNEEAVKTLLQHGACPSVEDRNGHTPIDVAITSEHTNLIETLVDHGGKSGNSHDVLSEHFLSQFFTITAHEMITLLRAGLCASVKHAPAHTYSTNLLFFVIENMMFVDENMDTVRDILRLMITAGVDINEKNNYGECALNIAMPLSLTKMIVALLELGADATAVFPINGMHSMLYLTVILQYCPAVVKLKAAEESFHDALCCLLPVSVKTTTYVNKLIAEDSPVVLFGKHPSCHFNEFRRITAKTCPSRWLQSFDEACLGGSAPALKLLKELRKPKVPSLLDSANRVVREHLQMNIVKKAELLKIGTLTDILVLTRE